MNNKKIFYFSIGPFSSAALGLITLPIITWFFSAEDIGRVTMFQVAIRFSILLFSLGLDQAYVREYHEVEDKASLLKSTTLPGIIFLFIVLLTLVFLPWSTSYLLFGIESRYLTLLLFLAILVAFISRFLSLILRMQERGLAFSMSQVLPKLMFLIIIWMYVEFSFRASFDNLILAHVASLVSVLLVFVWNTKTDWLPAFRATINKERLKSMVQFGLPLIAGGLSFWGLTAMDRFFLRGMSSFEELGIYSVAVNFAGVALIFQSVFSTVWVPTVYKWAAEGIKPERIQKVTEYTLLAVIIIWSLAGMLSWLVSYLLPSEYDRVQYILVAAMAYPLLYTLSEATSVGVGIKRKTVFTLVAALLALGVNAVGNYLLIPEYGASGAAIASAIAFLCFFVIKTEISSKIWVSFPRLKMYFYMLLMVILSSTRALQELKTYVDVAFCFMFIVSVFELLKLGRVLPARLN